MLDYDFKRYPKNRLGKYLLGVEIEASSSNFNTRYAKFVRGCEFIVKSDGSIIFDDYSTYGEFVSLPLPEKVLKAKVKKLYTLYSPKTNYSCGLHIHVSKTAFKLQNKIQERVYYLGQVDFRKLAGRGRNTYNDGSLYSRYCAVNTQCDKTVEFRLFAASDNYRWVWRCIDVTRALIVFDSNSEYWFDEFEKFFNSTFGYSLSELPKG